MSCELFTSFIYVYLYVFDFTFQCVVSTEILVFLYFRNSNHQFNPFNSQHCRWTTQIEYTKILEEMKKLFLSHVYSFTIFIVIRCCAFHSYLSFYLKQKKKKRVKDADSCSLSHVFFIGFSALCFCLYIEICRMKYF